MISGYKRMATVIGNLKNVVQKIRTIEAFAEKHGIKQSDDSETHALRSLI